MQFEPIFYFLMLKNNFVVLLFFKTHIVWESLKQRTKSLNTNKIKRPKKEKADKPINENS